MATLVKGVPDPGILQISAPVTATPSRPKLGDRSGDQIRQTFDQENQKSDEGVDSGLHIDDFWSPGNAIAFLSDWLTPVAR